MIRNVFCILFIFAFPSFGGVLEAKKSLEKELKCKISLEANENIVHDTLLSHDKAYEYALSMNSDVGWGVLFKRTTNEFVRAEILYQRGLRHFRSEDYDKSYPLFERLEFDFREQSLRLHRVKLMQAYSLIKMEETSVGRNDYLERAKNILKSYPESAPERYRETAIWLQRELRGDGSGPLLELSKYMGAISRLLKEGKTGHQPTQLMQREVEKQLKKLIELMENQKSGGGSDCKKCQGKGCRECEKPQPKSGKDKPTEGLNKSRLPMEGNREGKLQNVETKKAEDAWGGLQAKEREKVLQGLKDKFPAQYQDIIEQYFKSLSDGKKRVGEKR